MKTCLQVGLSVLFNAMIVISFAQYCTPTGPVGGSGCTDGDLINSFTLGSISNLNTGCAGGAARYSDYTLTTLVKGIQYTAAATLGGWQEGIGIWCDWNQDGDFIDAGEFYSNNTITPAGGTENISITVPYGALNGTTRMRVACFYFEVAPQSNSCTTTNSFFEYEDYTIVVGEQANNLHFDGINDVVMLGNSMCSSFSGQTQASMEAWVNPSTMSSNTIVGNHASGGNQLTLRLFSDGRLNGMLGFGPHNATSTAIVPINHWTHVAITVGGGMLRVYINGAEAAATSIG